MGKSFAHTGGAKSFLCSFRGFSREEVQGGALKINIYTRDTEFFCIGSIDVPKDILETGQWGVTNPT